MECEFTLKRIHDLIRTYSSVLRFSLTRFSLKTLKKLYGLFLWMRFNCLKATLSLRGDSLLFTIILAISFLLISDVGFTFVS